MLGTHTRVPLWQRMLRKGKTVRPRFQRTGGAQEQMRIGIVGCLGRTGPKLLGQFEQGVQFAKACVFHVQITARVNTWRCKAAIVMNKACIYCGTRRLYCRAGVNSALTQALGRAARGVTIRK